MNWKIPGRTDFLGMMGKADRVAYGNDNIDPYVRFTDLKKRT